MKNLYFRLNFWAAKLYKFGGFQQSKGEKIKKSKKVADLKRDTKRRELSESSKSELVARKRKRVRDSLGALRSPT